MVVIGLIAFDKCGKSTTLGYMEEFLKSNNVTYKTIHFADILKKQLSTMFDIDLEKLEVLKDNNVPILETKVIDEKEYTVRDLLVNLSVATRDIFGMDAYTNKSKIDIESYINDSETDVILIHDIRFESEYNMLLELSDKVDLHLVELKSDFVSCGSNKRRYDIDKIIPDIILEIKDGEYEDNKKRVNQLLLDILFFLT